MTTTADPKVETQLLVQANVTGTLKVYSRDGDKIGTVQALLVHKGSGRTTHAVLSLGGFMGMGKSFYAVPFGLLEYDHAQDQYRVTVDRRLLEGGPSWSNNAPTFDQGYADRVASYYGVATEDVTNG